MFEEYIARAVAIRLEIARLQVEMPVVVGFPSPSLIEDAYQALGNCMIRSHFNFCR